MDKIKLTKGELKRQRDALRQYERYLPTLQLKKQQLQLELLNQHTLVREKRQRFSSLRKNIEIWAGLFSEENVNISPWIVPVRVKSGHRNIAGVDIPVFETAEFSIEEYDLFLTPHWVDGAIEEFVSLVSLKNELEILDEGIRILEHELRITNQRVNLFEKVKIPETKEVIHIIKIFIGDQMANAVGRSKIAKRKIESQMLEGIAV